MDHHIQDLHQKHNCEALSRDAAFRLSNIGMKVARIEREIEALKHNASSWKNDDQRYKENLPSWLVFLDRIASLRRFCQAIEEMLTCSINGLDNEWMVYCKSATINDFGLQGFLMVNKFGRVLEAAANYQNIPTVGTIIKNDPGAFQRMGFELVKPYGKTMSPELANAFFVLAGLGQFENMTDGEVLNKMKEASLQIISTDKDNELDQVPSNLV